ncbi:MAG: 3-deoxy-D-manno-octulosonate 8-phosphate phosphatase [Chitinophagaceae bacterium]
MNVLENFSRITTFIFDVDGVLTDGSVLLLENGIQARRMNVKDGLALQMALKHNYSVVIVSGGYSQQVVERMHYLGIREVYMATGNKLSFIKKYLSEKGLGWDGVLFMGDDLPDVPVLKQAGLSCCPADAVQEAKEASKYISHLNGGYGCVRDVIEKVLRLNNHWQYETDITSK